MTPLQAHLLVAALLFVLGLGAVLTRRNAVIMLVGVELMLNAANLNFLAFSRYGPEAGASSGVIFMLFSVAIAAAEAAVGLALILALNRHYRTLRAEEADRLKG